MKDISPIFWKFMLKLKSKQWYFTLATEKYYFVYFDKELKLSCLSIQEAK